MSVTERLVTAKELFKMPDDDHRYELIMGELIRMPPAGFEHGAINLNLGGPLRQYIKSKDLGAVVGAETGFKLASDPDTVLGPDVAFVRRDRLPSEGILKGYWQGPPDLAAEIVSPGDTALEVEEKVQTYLEAGTRMVWVINPKRQTVTVYRSLTEIAILQKKDTLDGGDVIPGFHLKVEELFQSW